MRVKLLPSAAVVLTILASCTSTTSSTTTSAESSVGPSPVAQGPSPSTQGASPAGLERFYNQSLIWTRCQEFINEKYGQGSYLNPMLECSRLSVPLDYADAAEPDTPVLSLGVMRKKSLDSARIGAVVLTRGATELGLNLVASASGPGITELNKSFDLVGFDQRGMGASGPRIDCLTDEEFTAMRRTDQRTATDAGLAAATAEAATFAPGCLAKTTPPAGADALKYLGLVGTREAAQDLDILRSALGEEQLSLMGLSYGSRLVREYTENYTDRVRALVLDGVHPATDQATMDRAWYAAIQRAFEGYVGWCGKTTYCPVSADPAVAVADYQTLVRPLLDAPRDLPDGRVLGFDAATAATLGVLAEEYEWPALSSALLALQRGDVTPMMDLADGYWGYGDDQYWGSLDASIAATCLDGPAPLTGEQAAQVAAEGIRTAPFLDSGEVPRAHPWMCDSWPAPATLEPPATDIPGLPPALVISVEGNTSTPHQFAVDLAAAWDVSLLTVAGTGSGTYLREMTCVDDVVTDFLVTLRPIAAGTTC